MHAVAATMLQYHIHCDTHTHSDGERERSLLATILLLRNILEHII